MKSAVGGRGFEPEDSATWARFKARDAGLLPRWTAAALRWREDAERAKGEREANLEFLGLIDRMRSAPLRPDAADAEVIDRATRCADECAALMQTIGGDAYETGARYCTRWKIDPPNVKEGRPVAPALARMRCPLWWRRKLRAALARANEGAAIALGFVGSKADKYVSEETMRRHSQQVARNRRTLAATIAENDEGQRLTLAELAARSVADAVIRRGELITRLKGFESIGDDCDHRAVFVTLTAPSRYHPTSGGERNPRHDGSTPADAQRHLAKTWARIRSKLDREGVPVYGFRIAEPHADGCPHWHLILWVPDAARLAVLWSVMRRHALAEDGDEAGASRHRITFDRIDRERGSAVGYVIKYIAKAIDGFKVGEWRIDGDLCGDDQLNLSPRVVAWASTWRIRQFQQIGGPPVGLWREVRRVPSEKLAEAPQVARDAWLAAQRFECSPKGADAPVMVARADFGEFVLACGGPVMRRRDRPLMLATRPSEVPTRYGDEATPRPCGLWAVADVLRDFGGAVGALVVGRASRLIESLRRVWRIVRGEPARRAGPWTCVNNCTADDDPARDRWRPGDPVSPADSFRSWAYG